VSHRGLIHALANGRCCARRAGGFASASDASLLGRETFAESEAERQQTSGEIRLATNPLRAVLPAAPLRGSRKCRFDTKRTKTIDSGLEAAARSN
jgi:hypothetical protein